MAEGTCSIEGCDRYDRVRRGMCPAHYERWRRNGDAGAGAIRRIDPSRVCSIDECGRPYWATDLCSIHYVRRFKSGDPKAHEPIIPRGADNVGYDGAHKRIRAIRGPASDHLCAHCSAQASTWGYDHADADALIVENYKGTPKVPYSLKPEHYMPLCGSCHKRYDLHTLRHSLRAQNR